MSNPRKARGPYKRWMNDEYDDTTIPRTTKWRRQNFDSSENITSDRLNIYSEDPSPTETFGNGSNLHGISNELIDSTDEDCTIQTSFSDQSEEIHGTHDHLQTESICLKNWMSLVVAMISISLRNRTIMEVK